MSNNQNTDEAQECPFCGHDVIIDDKGRVLHPWEVEET